MITALNRILTLVASLSAGLATAADSVPGSWEKSVQQAALVKEGLERLHHPQYQYECLGLGGTVMRVGPGGFTIPGASGINKKGGIRHRPYLSYQYWWDEEAHRHLPFDLTGGYGKNVEPEQVTTFRHSLDIASGLLTIDLGLRVDVAGTDLRQTGTKAFQSRREMFVTPEGVVVIRVASAWKKAETAQARGYDALRQETAEWWKAFYARSGLNLPDRDLAIWYARSTYHLGMFFGNTDVPPGCNGTSVERFDRAVCPEYDMVLNQMALLYGNHFDEARRVVDWLGRSLPRAERYAREGLTLHKVSVKYSGGAKFGPLMGYDGTILMPPTEGEGIVPKEMRGTLLQKLQDGILVKSQIHSCFTSPGGWFYQGVAGIRADEADPGFKKIVIKPAGVGDLTWVKAHHDSPYGRIASHGRRDGTQLSLDITIPANTTATVCVPPKDAAGVTESGKPANSSEGVKFLGMENNAAVYAVGSGLDRFQSTLS